MTIPAVSWVVGDIETPLQGYSAGTTAFGGFAQARGVIRESDARRYPSSVTQGSTVTGYTQGGLVVYQGRLSAPPAIRGGLASFAAQGESIKAAKFSRRLLFQNRDYSKLTAVGANPHGGAYTASADVLETQHSDGWLYWVCPTGAIMDSGKANGFVFWAPGTPGGVTRYAFNIVKITGHTSLLHFRTFRADGPQGTPIEINTHSLGSGDSLGVDQASGSQDSVIIDVLSTSSWTNGGVYAVGLRDLRINGIAPGDTYTGSQVVTQVGAFLGYDTSKVTSTGLNVLPLDWTSGSWAELLSYIATLEDRYWRVVEDSRLEFEPWGTKEWTVYQADGATVDLTPLELYNQVTVKYVDVGGAPREVTVSASPDPLAASGIVNVWEESLADVQPNADLATAVANNLLPRVSTLREQGRINAVKAYDHTGREAVREIRAGDTIRVADRDMNTATLHRVFETDQDSEGVACGIEGGVSIASLLGRAGLVSARAPSTAELPELEIAAVEAGTIPSEEQQHRDRFLTWPQGFPKRGTGHGRG